MTYNVFGGMLNLAQLPLISELGPVGLFFSVCDCFS